MSDVTTRLYSGKVSAVTERPMPVLGWTALRLRQGAYSARRVHVISVCTEMFSVCVCGTKRVCRVFNDICK